VDLAAALHEDVYEADPVKFPQVYNVGRRDQPPAGWTLSSSGAREQQAVPRAVSSTQGTWKARTARAVAASGRCSAPTDAALCRIPRLRGAESGYWVRKFAHRNPRAGGRSRPRRDSVPGPSPTPL
jgi:hypothetical protein